MTGTPPRSKRRFLHRVTGAGLGIITLSLALGVAVPAPAAYNHFAHGVTTYEGSKTCNQCHLDKAKEVYASEHYQWKGKLGAINDFCTYPDTNWLFNFPVGSTAAAGCATCHVGLDDTKPPFPATPTAAALDKIDCLMCHSDTYNHVGQMVSGQPVVVPDNASAANMPAILAAIGKPSKAACLKCHAKAGGGNGIKQGDLDLSMAHPDISVDVHMSSAGANLTCVSCHKTQAHRIAGKGNDLRVADSPAKVSCTNCHGALPHARINEDLDKHREKVDCTVCHIPNYAKGVVTEINRDNEFPELLAGKYEGKRTLGANLVPQILKYDGKSFFYKFNTVMSVEAPDGNFLMAGPYSVVPGAKLNNPKYYPFKVHTARMAVDRENRIIPLNAQTFWSTGDIDGQISKFVDVSRYLGLYHQVAPKAQAYGACVQCHKNGIPH
ncbi:MAG: cytochrome c3 family protein [Thermodesulfobacteriota bacterium]